MIRLTFSIRGLAAIALCSLLIGQRPLAAQETCSPDLAAHSFNFVAVGMCDSDIILATPIDDSHWWSRTLQIPQQGRRPTQASLARTGTKLGLYYADTGEVAIWDLTALGAPSLQPTHYITRQTYEFDGKDGKVYRDDHGRDTSERYLARKVDTPGPLVEGRNSPAGQRHCEWSTYQVEPEPGLYAPILEFTSSEQVFPSTTGIWPLSQVATQPVWAEKKPSRLSEANRRRFPSIERFSVKMTVPTPTANSWKNRPSITGYCRVPALGWTNTRFTIRSMSDACKSTCTIRSTYSSK